MDCHKVVSFTLFRILEHQHDCPERETAEKKEQIEAKKREMRELEAWKEVPPEIILKDL